jgi:hypothetical protein
VLPAIQAVEGGTIGAVSLNADGSQDLGIMQINSRWVPVLAQATHLSPAVVRDRLIMNGCYSILVAGAILRLHRAERHGDMLTAIGDYHSRTPLRNQAYLGRVVDAATTMFPPAAAPRHPRIGP